MNIITDIEKSDNFQHFIKEIKENTEIEFKVYKDFIDNHNKNTIILYFIDNQEILEKDYEKIIENNANIIIVGNKDPQLSLYCGKFNVIYYFEIEKFEIEKFKKVVSRIDTNIFNTKKENQILLVSGISGGLGTTTIAMNAASMIADNNRDKNVLFIDLSKTKSISNLFLQKNPLPEKSIIDLIESKSFDMNSNLNNGLVKLESNFFMINGVQKHIDGVLLEDEEYMLQLFSLIEHFNHSFNHIIIDIGLADSSTINSNLYSLCDDIWLITEMNIPHISKVKTFYSLMKRAGILNKLNIVVNRYDSKNSINISNIASILGLSETDDFKIKLPNDYASLGHAWNYCKLVSQENKKSPFVKTLVEILINNNLIDLNKKEEKEESSMFDWLKGKK